MNAETKTCQNCKAQFVVEPDDFGFYEKIGVPPPTFCPQCRLIRRIVFRNERTLYKRKCDLCGAEKIFMYPPNTPFPVYCKPCWWSDQWDSKSFGRAYDFSKSFFEQFGELFLAVPRCGVIQQGNSLNSEYTNRVTDMKNCYLVFATTNAENSRYSAFIQNSKECIDCFSAIRSERCIECIDCLNCYNVHYSQESKDCRDSYFLKNCRNCSNCFGCVNLVNKQYHIFNTPYTKEEYEKHLSELDLGSVSGVAATRAQVEQLAAKLPRRSLVSVQTINVSGNWIENCKNLHDSFACQNVEEGRYCFFMYNEKDAMDHSHWGNHSERMYECVNVGIQCANVRFSNECWNQLIDAEYCMNCHSSQNLFGCVGIRNGRFAVLNKEYKQEEFSALREKIIKHMKDMPHADSKGRTYRYGEFFPHEISPHAYNETIAQEFFPQSKQEILDRGHRWRDPDTKQYPIAISAGELPDRIADAPDSIAGQVIGCMHAGKCNHQCTTAFRILPEDLTAYRNALLPLPRLCVNCRHHERLAQRTPMKLWHRKCQCAGMKSENGIYANVAKLHTPHAAIAHCPNEFETSYAPDRKEIVYCEQCYQSEIA